MYPPALYENGRDNDCIVDEFPNLNVLLSYLAGSKYSGLLHIWPYQLTNFPESAS